MSALAALFISNLPTIVGWVSKLKQVPEAVGTVSEIVAYVNSTIVHIKQHEPLTPEGEAQLDAYIDAMATAPEQQITD